MNSLNITGKKIIWAEGVMLSQQHMQYWEAHQHNKNFQLFNLLQPHFWGVRSFTIDLPLLLTGVFKVEHCQWLLPYGELIEIDSLQLNLREYNQAEIDIYLTQANNKLCADIPGYHVEAQSSWQAQPLEVNDQFDSMRSVQVLVAKPVVKLQAYLPTKDNHSIHLAKVWRNQYGEYRLSEIFIPSLLQIKYSMVLMNYLNDYLSLAISKYQELKNIKETSAKLLNFMLSQVIAQFQLFKKDGNIHPYALYAELNKLISSLSIYHDNIDILTLPNYQHDDLTNTFENLHQLVISVLQVNLKSRVANIHFVRQSENIYLTEMMELDIVNNYEFFVAVKIVTDAIAWIDEFTRYAKLGASNMIETIVASALPGLTMRYLQHMPSNFPNKPGFHYFHVQKQGEFWLQVQQHQQIALFLAQQFESANIEILVLRGIDETD